MKRIFICLCLTLISVFPSIVSAKKGVKIWEAVQKNYPEAKQTRALLTAAENLDPSTLRGFVVVLKGGIPAERAPFFIGWEEYDYRGSVIENDQIDTRRGKIYTFLQPGDILAVSHLQKLGRRIQIRLITPQVYVPENRRKDKRHSRVTCSLGFKLPKTVYKNDNVVDALQYIGQWLKPFPTYPAAKAFSQQLRGEKPIQDPL